MADKLRGRGGSSTQLFDSTGNGEYGAPAAPSRSSNNNLQVVQAGGGRGNPQDRPGSRDGGVLQLNLGKLKARCRELATTNQRLQRELDISRQQNADLQRQMQQREIASNMASSGSKKEADFQKRLRLAAEQRAAALESNQALLRRQAEGFDEAQSGLIQETQVLLQQKNDVLAKLKQTESEMVMHKQLVEQLKQQLDHMQLENAELRAAYNNQVTQANERGAALSATAFQFGEDDLMDGLDDYELYGDIPLGTSVLPEFVVSAPAAAATETQAVGDDGGDLADGVAGVAAVVAATESGEGVASGKGAGVEATEAAGDAGAAPT